MFCWTVHQKGEWQLENYAPVVVGHEVYYFGGVSHCPLMAVHIFNSVSLCWNKLPPVRRECPHMRLNHTAVLVEGAVYIWGGHVRKKRTHSPEGLYAFEVDARRWFKPVMSGTVPEESVYHSACVLGKTMFIHGGITKTHGWTNDTHKLDTSTTVWSLINVRGMPPPASKYRSATIIGTKIFLSAAYGYPNTIRVFDTETDLWLNTPPAQPLPVEEHWHNSSAFAYNGELYIIVCTSTKRRYRKVNGLWKLNPDTFTWKTVWCKGKCPSKMGMMCCCMVGDRVVLVDIGRSQTPNALYILDLSPSLKTLCKLAVIQDGLEQSGLPHNIRWELEAMPTYRE